MTRKTADPDELTQTAVVLTPSMSFVRKDRHAPNFFQDLAQEFDGFHGHTLVSDFHFDGDWGTWEVHPNGDELIYLLSGSATFLYVLDGEEVSAHMDRPGQYIVIPKGAWHTARTDVPTHALFLTPGEGTLHAESPPA